MFRKSRSSLILFSLFSLTFAQEMDLPTPTPWEIEKRRIEEKYGTKPPELGKGQVKEEKKEEKKPPKIQKKKVYQIGQDVMKEPKREPIFGVNLKKEEQTQTQTQAQTQTQTQGGSQEEGEVRSFKARCVVEKPIEVSIEEKRELLQCLVIEGLNKRLVQAEFVFIPEPREYRLTAKVVSIDQRPVEQAVVIDAQKGTLNLADVVNTRLISKILLKTAQKTGQQVSSTVENILKQAGTTTVTGLGNVVQRTDVEESLKQVPKTSLYLALANLISSTSEEVLRDERTLPVLFKINRGKELEVRGILR